MIECKVLYQSKFSLLFSVAFSSLLFWQVLDMVIFYIYGYDDLTRTSMRQQCHFKYKYINSPFYTIHLFITNLRATNSSLCGDFILPFNFLLSELVLI